MRAVVLALFVFAIGGFTSLVGCGRQPEPTRGASPLLDLLPTSVTADRALALPGETVTFTVVFADDDAATVRASVCDERLNDGRDLACLGRDDERTIAVGPARKVRDVNEFTLTYAVPSDVFAGLSSAVFEERVLLRIERRNTVTMLLATVNVARQTPQAVLLSESALEIETTTLITDADLRMNLTAATQIAAGTYRVVVTATESTDAVYVLCSGKCSVANEGGVSRLTLMVGEQDLVVIAKSRVGKIALGQYHLQTDAPVAQGQ